MKQPEQIELKVQVVFPMQNEREFTYAWPKNWNPPKEGARVLVPLGRSKRKGFISGVHTKPLPKKILLKPVLAILDDAPILTPNLLRLIKWTSAYYQASFGSVLRTAVPQEGELFTSFAIKQTDKNGNHRLTKKQKEILKHLDDEPKDFRILAEKLAMPELLDEIFSLVSLKICEIEPVQKNRRQRPLDQFVRLVLNPSELDDLHQQKLGKKQKTTIEALQSGEQSFYSLRENWGIQSSVLKRIEKKGWIEITHRPGSQVILPVDHQIKEIQKLTQNQQDIFENIQKNVEESRFCVDTIFGVPGSGKTEIYLHLAKSAIEKNKTVIILVPEITLTSQIAARFQSVFGEKVALWHSGMSRSERTWTWEKFRAGQAKIAIGARSAVFAPLENLGLIVVDEEQESAFKQQNPAPRYHARDVAIKRGQIENAVVVLGSATPSLESYFNTISGKFRIHELKQRFGKSLPPEILIVDMKSERKEKGEFTLFSETLLREMSRVLSQKKQIILLQNRRGFSPFVTCGECGFIESCVSCNVSLTYHKYGNTLLCHHCGARRNVRMQCPECDSERWFFSGLGTQRLEEMLKEDIPEIRILRMDQDTTSKPHAHAEILNRFLRKEADVLLGTQMIGKGLDFPDVALVGIIQADLGLHYPDFRSRERTFQLLYQVAGRAGRRDERGKVVIQTAFPDDIAIRAVMTGKIKEFYANELSERNELKYPPFSRTAMLMFYGKNQAEVENSARAFRQWIDQEKNRLQVLGPVPLIIEKLRNVFRWKIQIRSDKEKDPNGTHLRSFLSTANGVFLARKKFKSVSMTVDVDPMDT